MITSEPIRSREVNINVLFSVAPDNREKLDHKLASRTVNCENGRGCDKEEQITRIHVGSKLVDSISRI